MSASMTDPGARTATADDDRRDGASPVMGGTELASHIDHTVLRPDARAADVDHACRVARALGCAAVCVNPIHVARVRDLLAGSPVLVVAVVGFPFGATYTAVKVLETQLAVRDGADEIDMVVPIGQFRDELFDLVEHDVAAVVRAAAGRPVKVILECGLLTDAQKRRGAEIAARAGAAFVKTSTGFLGSGATVHDVRLLHDVVGGTLLVKATGGIRSFEDAVAMLEAGASRLGASRTEAILASRVVDPTPPA
jgi:deoxyribose-phosphate aldolase